MGRNRWNFWETGEYKKWKKGWRQNRIERDWKERVVEGKIKAQIIWRPQRLGNIKAYKLEGKKKADKYRRSREKR